MDARLIKILAIEDSWTDARLLRARLNDVAHFNFDLRHESDLATGLTALGEEAWDAVLLDLMLPDSMGLETVDRVHDVAPGIPIVVLTHVEDQLHAIEAVRRGAQDYLFKGNLDGHVVSRAVAYAIERKRSERVLSESLHQRQVLESEILRISAREQQRISRDLHDSVGQQLTGLSFMARSLAKRLAAQSLAEASDAQVIVDEIQAALGEVRNAIRGLTPVDVDDGGLMVALKRFVASAQSRFGIECRFTCHSQIPIKDNDTATHLFRITQEALHNAVRHAHADHVLVSLYREGGHLVLKVTDNGSGFEVIPEGPSGLGFDTMHYRARMIDATLDVSTTSDSGTTVTCKIKDVASLDHA